MIIVDRKLKLPLNVYYCLCLQTFDLQFGETACSVLIVEPFLSADLFITRFLYRNSAVNVCRGLFMNLLAPWEMLQKMILTKFNFRMLDDKAFLILKDMLVNFSIYICIGAYPCW